MDKTMKILIDIFCAYHCETQSHFIKLVVFRNNLIPSHYTIAYSRVSTHNTEVVCNGSFYLR